MGQAPSEADAALCARQAAHLIEVTQALSALIYAAGPEREQGTAPARRRWAGIVALALYLNLYQRLTLAAALERYRRLGSRLKWWALWGSLGSAMVGSATTLWLGSRTGVIVGGALWLGLMLGFARAAAQTSRRCAVARSGQWREEAAYNRLLLREVVTACRHQTGCAPAVVLPELLPVARQLAAAARSGDRSDPARQMAAQLVVEVALWESNRRVLFAARRDRRRDVSLRWCALTLGLGMAGLTVLLIWLFRWLLALLYEAMRG